MSRACPKNAKGVYVNGGSCKMCGAVDHLVKDCPKNARARRAAAEEATVEEEGEARIDEGMEASSKTGERKEKKRREVVF